MHYFGEILNPQKFFFPGCDQPLSSPYIISIFEYIVKHAGDLFAWKVYRLRGNVLLGSL